MINTLLVKSLHISLIFPTLNLSSRNCWSKINAYFAVFEKCNHKTPQNGCTNEHPTSSALRMSLLDLYKQKCKTTFTPSMTYLYYCSTEELPFVVPAANRNVEFSFSVMSHSVGFMLLNILMRKYRYQYITWCLEYGGNWRSASTVYTHGCRCGDSFFFCLILVAVSSLQPCKSVC